MNFKSYKSALCLATAAVALSAFPGIALAQENEEEDEDRIVVTGTLIRGVEVAGAQAIDLDAAAIAEAGASTTAELLGTLPQVSNFFNGRIDSDPRSADRQQVSRPNLRNLPGVTSTTGHTTLLLVDGHRMTPMGVDQASFDLDFIPANAIERMEVITDGGSSLYGADAVGGVINTITRRRFDGIEVSAGYDVGEDYDAWNAGVIGGTSWNGGGAFIAYSYFNRENILNNDRDYAERGQWNAAGTVLTPSGTQCLTPVGEIVTWANFGAGWTDNPLAASLGVKRTPVGTPCDIDGESSLMPALERHSVLGGLEHSFSDSVQFSLKANWGQSDVTYSRYPQGDTITEQNPNQLGLAGTRGQTYDVASVGFSYGANSAYVHRDQELDLSVWGVTPELTFDIGSDWQLKTTGYYGASDNHRRLPGSNRTKMIAYVNSGALDPTNVAAAAASVITDINNFEVAGDAKQSLLLGRAVLDGPLVEMPAGELRVALGVEYNRDRASLRSGSFTIDGIDNVPFRTATRNVKSVFGEFSIPVFTLLDLSLSARYDDYSDFGTTFNPSVGFNFHPFDQLRIYGHWSESYNAPTALDSVRTANGRFIANAAAGVPDPNGERAATPTRDDVLLLEGSGGGLEPQSAETWAGGMEFEPVDNLVFGASYYDIDFVNLLSSVNPQLASVVLLNPDKFNFNPTQAEYDAALTTIENGAQFAGIAASDVGVIIDRRVANLDAAKLTGIDFFARYSFDTSFGTISAGISGNHQISFDITSSGNTVDQLMFDNSTLVLSGNVGIQSGGFRARLTVNHTGGFDTNIAVAQKEVGTFTVADLALGYEFGEGSGAFEGLAFRINVDNLLDQEPPVYRQQRNLNYSGFTLGRIFKFGVSKRF